MSWLLFEGTYARWLLHPGMDATRSLLRSFTDIPVAGGPGPALCLADDAGVWTGPLRS